MSLKRSRHLRQNATDAEQALWTLLRNRQLAHYKFRRQYPLDPFTADFACVAKKLIVEADGSQHANNPQDIFRTQTLAAQGWRTLRFWNTDILTNPDGVLHKILSTLSEK